MGFVLESPLPRTGRGRFVPGAILLVLLALALWGCRANRPNFDPDTGARSAAGVTVFVYTEEWGGAISAVGGRGRLAILDGGCLGLTDGSLFVFPNGSKVTERDGEVAVEVPQEGPRGARTVGPGDDIGIGAAAPGPVADFGGHLQDHVPATCRGREATSGIEFYP